MAENEKVSEPAGATPPGDAPPPPPKRSPGHRGADVKDTVAEMAAKAHEISLEAGSKMAAAMKDVVNAAAGLSGFVMESARDLVQFMVRRGQMTQEEADKLIRQVEEHQPKRPKNEPAKPIHAETTKHETRHAPAEAQRSPVQHPTHQVKATPPAKAAAKPAAKAAAKPAAKAPPKKPAAKAVKSAPKKAKPAKPAAKKSPPKKAAGKSAKARRR